MANCHIHTLDDVMEFPISLRKEINPDGNCLEKYYIHNIFTTNFK